MIKIIAKNKMISGRSLLARRGLAGFTGGGRACARCLLVLAILGSRSIYARDWVAYSTDNFTLYSDRREKEILGTLERFELFRQVSLEMLAAPDLPENERLRIFLFDRRADFNRIQGDMNVGGFFYHSISGPRMLVAPEGEDEVLFHEYVHYLMNRHSNVNYPLWYSEGLAGVLESIEIDEEEVRIGLPASSFEFISRLSGAFGSYYQPAPMVEMISLEPRVGVGSFYATAWLMVHYFLIDSVDDPERLQQTAEYLLRFDAGADPVEAFSESYGISPEQMHSRLDAYSREREFKTIVFPGMKYLGSSSYSTLEDAESLYLLADLAVELGRNDAADRYLSQFERRGRDSSLALEMQALQAIAHIHEGQIEEGDALFERLLSLEIHDPNVAGKIIHYATDRVIHARDSGEDLNASELERVIQLGVSVATENPSHSETLYYLGRAYELRGDLQFAARILLQFYAGNPTVPEVNMLLAKIFIVGGQRELGSEFLSRVYSASHSEEGRAILAEIRDRIEDVDFVAETIEGLLTGSISEDRN